MNRALPEPAAERSLTVILPDDSRREVAPGTTGTKLAASIGKGLVRAALAMEVDGELWDLARELPDGARVRFVRAEDAPALPLLRHDAAHVLAEAVQELFPGTQVTIGPSIEDGFYYDFARDEPFSPDDFAKIESDGEIVDRDEPIRREVWDRDEAIAYFEAIGETLQGRDHRRHARGRDDHALPPGRRGTTCAAGRTCRRPAVSARPSS